MTVLDIRKSSDEESNTQKRKKIRLSATSRQHQTEKAGTVEAWLNSLNDPANGEVADISVFESRLNKSNTTGGCNPGSSSQEDIAEKTYKSDIESRSDLNQTQISNWSEQSLNLSHGTFGEEMVSSYNVNHAHMRPEENGCIGHMPTPPVAPLLNLGNTCFLNSVLYTLRFAPLFLHKLHHLSADSSEFIRQIYASKEKASSLGRGICRPYLTTYVGNSPELKMQQVIEKLHNLYRSLYYNELKDHVEPLPPSVFLHALREVNPIFMGNQQQDAHELLVSLLDIIREVCEVLYQQDSILERHTITNRSSSSGSSFRFLKHFRKAFRFNRSSPTNESNADSHSSSDLVNSDTESQHTLSTEISNQGSNVEEWSNEQDRFDDVDGYHNQQHSRTIFEDFQGVSILRTTCLNCEQVTERKETFCDICVPVQIEKECGNEDAVNRLYHSVIVTEEYLVDSNKYWCDRCVRYNEAKRCVVYQQLPRLLTLHLKRFSSTFGSMVAKLTDYMPTPLTLYCFCEECSAIEPLIDRPHVYHLYAVIMHLGATIASGHYIAYVRTYDNVQDYAQCKEDERKTCSLSRGNSFASSALNKHSFNDKPNGIRNSKILRKLTPGSSSKFDKYGDRIQHACKSMDCCSARLQNVIPYSEMKPGSNVWLECDDECVRMVSASDLAHMLNSNVTRSAATPYLLFYARAPS